MTAKMPDKFKTKCTSPEAIAILRSALEAAGCSPVGVTEKTFRTGVGDHWSLAYHVPMEPKWARIMFYVTSDEAYDKLDEYEEMKVSMAVAMCVGTVRGDEKKFYKGVYDTARSTEAVVCAS